MTDENGFPTAEEWDEQWEQAKKDKIKEWGGVPNEELQELIEDFRDSYQANGSPEWEMAADELEDLIDDG